MMVAAIFVTLVFTFMPTFAESAVPGAIRLVGGRNKHEGILQFNFGSQWKRICAYGWTDFETQIVCKELGSSNYARAVSGSCVLDEESQLIFHCNRSIGNLLLNDCNNIQTYASCPSITVTCTDDVPLKCHCFKSETQNNNSCSKECEDLLCDEMHDCCNCSGKTCNKGNSFHTSLKIGLPLLALVIIPAIIGGYLIRKLKRSKLTQKHSDNILVSTNPAYLNKGNVIHKLRNSEGKTAPKIPNFKGTTSIAHSSNKTDKQHWREADDGNDDTTDSQREYVTCCTAPAIDDNSDDGYETVPERTQERRFEVSVVSVVYENPSVKKTGEQKHFKGCTNERNIPKAYEIPITTYYCDN